MSDNIRDDSTQPGHGFAMSEPFPLNAGDRIAALERKNDELAAHVLAERKRRQDSDGLLGACADLLGEYGARHMVGRINQHLGITDAKEWRHPSVPVRTQEDRQ